jgi:transcriptional antiterminator NusG
MTSPSDIEVEDDQSPRWYIVHTYSGQEDLVKKNLDLRVQSLDMQDRIFEVLVPTEDEVIFKDGQRRSEKKKLFPGYILVQMTMDDESWYAVRNTPGVTGFVSTEDEYDKRPKPVPLEDKQENCEK